MVNSNPGSIMPLYLAAASCIVCASFMVSTICCLILRIVFVMSMQSFDSFLLSFSSVYSWLSLNFSWFSYPFIYSLFLSWSMNLLERSSWRFLTYSSSNFTSCLSFVFSVMRMLLAWVASTSLSVYSSYMFWARRSFCSRTLIWSSSLELLLSYFEVLPNFTGLKSYTDKFIV